MRENVWACRILLWFSFSCGQLSAWTLLAVTLERCMSIKYPVNIRAFCSAKKARVVIFVLFFASLLLNSQILIVFGDKQMADGVIRCQPISDFMGLIQTLTDFVVTVAMPCLLLTVFNVLIVVSLTRNRKHLFERAYLSRALPVPGISEFGAARCEPIGIRSVLRQRRERDRSLTATLVVVNTTFIFCNFPVGIYNIIYPYLGLTVNALFSIQILLVLVLFTGNAVNFLLYFVTGSKFRREFYAMFQNANIISK
ncbi:hypothetical protein Btru_021316 [Bulinus truncatus]|nr:hypothetical protein Btru_021316 [Bulinus truncatus]